MRKFTLLLLALLLVGITNVTAQLHTQTFNNKLDFTSSNYITSSSQTFNNVDGTNADFAFSWDSTLPGFNPFYDSGSYSGLSEGATFFITSGMGTDTYTLTLDVSGETITEMAFDIVHINWPGYGGGDMVTFTATTASGASITPLLHKILFQISR